MSSWFSCLSLSGYLPSVGVIVVVDDVVVVVVSLSVLSLIQLISAEPTGKNESQKCRSLCLCVFVLMFVFLLNRPMCV